MGGTGRHPLRERFLRGTWRRGDLRLDRYSPAKGGVRYLVHQADEIEIIGAPVLWRPRSRRAGSAAGREVSAC
jgi:hypothetical protein